MLSASARALWLILGPLLVFAALPESWAEPGWRSDGAQAAAAPRVFVPVVGRDPTPVPLPAGTPTTDDWLSWVNYYRATARQAPVTENPEWSDGAYKHSRYLLKNSVGSGPQAHEEDPSNPWYTPEGAAAGANGNVASDLSSSRQNYSMITNWAAAPFHAINMIHPGLRVVGYGLYTEGSANFSLTARGTLDVLRGRQEPSPLAYPVYWPAPGGTTIIGWFFGEYPEPLTSCPGYTTPTGVPITLQVGYRARATLQSHRFFEDGVELEHCAFDASSYVNPDPVAQSTARATLEAAGAVVLVPRERLYSRRYRVVLQVSGRTYDWSFDARPWYDERTVSTAR